MQHYPNTRKGPSDAKRRKYAYTRNTGSERRDLAPGMRGVLVTCNTHAEHEAIRESFRLLESLVEGTVEGFKTDTVGRPARASSHTTAGDALAHELSELQDKRTSLVANLETQWAGTQPLFTIAHTGCKGAFFIQFSKAAPDPVALVDCAIVAARATGGCARHIVRMVPIQSTCPAGDVKSIAAAAAPLLHASLVDFAGAQVSHDLLAGGSRHERRVVGSLTCRATQVRTLCNGAVAATRTSTRWL